jgi:type IV secretion system protein VirB6
VDPTDPTVQAALFGATPAGDTAAVNVNWTLFQSVFDTIDTPLTNAIDGMIGALTGYVVPILQVLVAIWIVWNGLIMAISPEHFSLGTFFRISIRAAVIVIVVQNTGTFNQWLGSPLRAVPTEVGNVLNGPVGGQTAINGGAPFDAVWNKSYVAGLRVFDNLPSVSFKGALLSVVVFAYWAVALAAVGISFLMFMAAQVLLALLIALGPIAVVMALFPVTRGIWMGWISASVSTIVSQILVVALLSLMLRVENAELARIAGGPAGANEVGQLGALMGVAALLAICAMLARQIPSIATGIAGGVYHNLNTYTSAAWSAARATGSSAASLARGTFVATGNHPPAGRSLSGP